MKQFIQYAFLSILLTSCLGTKFLAENEKLIAKEPRVRGIRPAFRDEVSELVIQQPNRRFLQLPLSYLVYAYETGLRNYDQDSFREQKTEVTEKFDRKIEKAKSNKRQNRLIERKQEKLDELDVKIREGNWLMQNGEKLAVLDTSLIDDSKNRIETFLSTKGYFDNDVELSIREIGKNKVRTIVDVNSGFRYQIDSLELHIQDSAVSKLVRKNIENSLLEKEMDYDQDILEQERERIYNQLVNHGFYGFSKQLISFQLDTLSVEFPGILVRTRILNSIDGPPQQFRVDSIVFLSEANDQIIESQTVEFKDVTYLFGSRTYDPQVIDWRLFVNKDSLFSTRATLETQRQLSYLDAFKFVNINYDSTENQRLIASIFTSPLNRFQTNYEVGAVSIAQLPGPFVNVGIKNRNTFGGLEITNLSASASLQGITSVQNQSNYASIQYSGELSITFPQILFPASENFKYRVGAFNPKSQLTLGYNYEDRLREYERSRIQSSFRYSWSRRENVQYSFTPLSLSYINVRRLTNSFDEFLDQQESLGNGALRAAFRSSVISSSSFETIFNSKEYSSGERNSYFLRIFSETGGNFIGELGQRVISNTEDFAFFKWAKLNIDLRALAIVDNDASFAFRLNVGAAYPYEERNLSLPYDKRFYVGGSNSLRGWPLRRLGPGAYGLQRTLERDPSLSTIDYRLEQGGDMVIEANVEYRKKLFRFIDYAAFIDAGNIWIINSDLQLSDQDGDDGIFRINEFYRELAMNFGLGLRVDFSFLVFRVDGALQIFDPAQSPGERYVLDNLNVLAPIGGSDDEKRFFSNKTNISIGIGFPF